MNLNNLHFKNIEEQDNFLQNLSAKELKELSKQSTFLFKNEEVVAEDEDLESESMDDLLMNMSVSQLKNLGKRVPSKKRKAYLIAVKSKATGLPETVIQQIEKNKGLASLNDIMIYCQKLKIPYQEFLPELFEV